MRAIWWRATSCTPTTAPHVTTPQVQVGRWAATTMPLGWTQPRRWKWQRQFASVLVPCLYSVQTHFRIIRSIQSLNTWPRSCQTSSTALVVLHLAVLGRYLKDFLPGSLAWD